MKTQRPRLVILPYALLTAILLAGCAGLGSGPTKPGTGGIENVNHIIFMYQENRSFDHYFGDLNNYRLAHGLPADVDVAPATVTNAARDGSGPIARFHFN